MIKQPSFEVPFIKKDKELTISYLAHKHGDDVAQAKQKIRKPENKYKKLMPKL